MKFITLLIALSLPLLQSCSNPSIHSVKKDEIYALTQSSLIYVPRFEGNPSFVEESTDYFINQLESKISNTIIQGSAIRAESPDIRTGGNLAPINLAFQDAKANKADILVLGKVTSHSTGGMMNGFSTIRVYNVKNKNKIANFHQPSGLLFAYSEHQCVMEAVENTANDFIGILK
jgi:hypothetical protein